MPYQQAITYPATTTGAQPSLNLDHSISPFNATLGVTFGAGASASYTIEFTIDNFDSPSMTDAQATWFTATGITSTTATSNIAGVLNQPVTRVRVNFSAAVSGGTVTFKTVQGLSKN